MSEENPAPAKLKRELLQSLPAITELLKSPEAEIWLQRHPAALVTDCLRQSVADARQRILEHPAAEAAREIEARAILARAGELLCKATTVRVRQAINATGIILHTGLGRAVLPPAVVDAVIPELKGCCTLRWTPPRGSGWNGMS